MEQKRGEHLIIISFHRIAVTARSNNSSVAIWFDRGISSKSNDARIHRNIHPCFNMFHHSRSKHHHYESKSKYIVHRYHFIMLYLIARKETKNEEDFPMENFDEIERTFVVVDPWKKNDEWRNYLLNVRQRKSTIDSFGVTSSNETWIFHELNDLVY